jgi:hypothetical protein
MFKPPAFLHHHLLAVDDGTTDLLLHHQLPHPRPGDRELWYCRVIEPNAWGAAAVRAAFWEASTADPGGPRRRAGREDRRGKPGVG